jgi:hypothetical protein
VQNLRLVYHSKSSVDKWPLAIRGWPNSGLRQFHTREWELAPQMPLQCRYCTRIWTHVCICLGNHDLDLSLWLGIDSIKEWWFLVIQLQGSARKATTSLRMLITWELWNEWNPKVFHNVLTLTPSIFSRIKCETVIWVNAGYVILVLQSRVSNPLCSSGFGHVM